LLLLYFCYFFIIIIIFIIISKLIKKVFITYLVVKTTQDVHISFFIKKMKIIYNQTIIIISMKNYEYLIFNI
jgi:hypothetical protein